MSTDGKSDGALKPNDLQRLHEFCRRGNVDMVEELLRKPQEKGQELVHQQGELGNYALHWAAQGEDAEFFLKNGLFRLAFKRYQIARTRTTQLV